MPSSKASGVRLALGLLVVPLAALGAVGLILGGQAGRPAWWLLGLAATLNALVLVESLDSSSLWSAWSLSWEDCGGSSRLPPSTARLPSFSA